ncbi:uncharacterized protein LOC129768759 [Toxorhynchites rutilus septentrionalis]|uniref:uncharacterized protein LOC129768759 n=1 Tax=Toxorhynchites rutilus septentrionalis TaxID=329112 RepID=UPI002478A922|nr:uncharacterized protein LOC129768759 [Toxorhynchites rutilus septentrionalis]
MERIFSGYIKAHGYAIAVAALTFGFIFAIDVLQVDDLRQTRSLDDSGVYLDRPSGGTYFRMRPLGQLIFSLVWILAGFIFLVGMALEKKETIFPFATIFAIDWSVILVQHLTKLERRSFHEVVLSVDTAVLVVIPVYVGFTLAVLYKLFECRPSETDGDGCDDIESSDKPVKFTLGDEFDDSWVS